MVFCLFRTMEEYCSKYVEKMGVDAEGPFVDIGLLLLALHCRGTIIYLDNREDVDLKMIESGVLPGSEETDIYGSVHLLLRPGHYDMLYAYDLFPIVVSKPSMTAISTSAPKPRASTAIDAAIVSHATGSNGSNKSISVVASLPVSLPKSVLVSSLSPPEGRKKRIGGVKFSENIIQPASPSSFPGPTSSFRGPVIEIPDDNEDLSGPASVSVVQKPTSPSIAAVTGAAKTNVAKAGWKKLATATKLGAKLKPAAPKPRTEPGTDNNVQNGILSVLVAKSNHNPNHIRRPVNTNTNTNTNTNINTNTNLPRNSDQQLHPSVYGLTPPMADVSPIGYDPNTSGTHINSISDLTNDTFELTGPQADMYVRLLQLSATMSEVDASQLVLNFNTVEDALRYYNQNMLPLTVNNNNHQSYARTREPFGSAYSGGRSYSDSEQGQPRQMLKRGGSQNLSSPIGSGSVALQFSPGGPESMSAPTGPGGGGGPMPPKTKNNWAKLKSATVSGHISDDNSTSNRRNPNTIPLSMRPLLTQGMSDTQILEAIHVGQCTTPEEVIAYERRKQLYNNKAGPMGVPGGVTIDSNSMAPAPAPMIGQRPMLLKQGSSRRVIAKKANGGNPPQRRLLMQNSRQGSQGFVAAPGTGTGNHGDTDDDDAAGAGDARRMVHFSGDSTLLTSSAAPMVGQARMEKRQVSGLLKKQGSGQLAGREGVNTAAVRHLPERTIRKQGSAGGSSRVTFHNQGSQQFDSQNLPSPETDNTSVSSYEYNLNPGVNNSQSILPPPLTEHQRIIYKRIRKLNPSLSKQICVELCRSFQSLTEYDNHIATYNGSINIAAIGGVVRSDSTSNASSKPNIGSSSNVTLTEQQKKIKEKLLVMGRSAGGLMGGRKMGEEEAIEMALRFRSIDEFCDFVNDALAEAQMNELNAKNEHLLTTAVFFGSGSGVTINSDEPAGSSEVDDSVGTPRQHRRPHFVTQPSVLQSSLTWGLSLINSYVSPSANEETAADDELANNTFRNSTSSNSGISGTISTNPAVMYNPYANGIHPGPGEISRSASSNSNALISTDPDEAAYRRYMQRNVWNKYFGCFSPTAAAANLRNF